MKLLISLLSVLLLVVTTPVMAVAMEQDDGLAQMPEPVIETLQIDFEAPKILTGERTTISLEGAHTLNQPGLPRVPFRPIHIELPAGATVTKVTARHGPVTITDLPAPLQVAPPAFPIGPGGPMDDFPVDMYYDGDLFPADWSAHDVGRGLNEHGEAKVFVNIFTYPVRVEGRGDGQKMHGIDGMDIEIQYRLPEEPHARSGRAEEYDMVIIAPDQFKEELQVLADHKDATGLRTRVVTLSDIYFGNIFTARGRDNAEKMKYFIKDALDNWSIKYVLLGGDIDKVPSRYVEVVDGFDDDGGMYLDGKWVVTDIYFADIYDGNNQFSSWDENQNNTFGEWLGGRDGAAVDDPDFYQDVYIGRFPVSTASELSAMIDKVIDYENSTNWGWYNKFAIAALNLFDPPTDPEDISEGEFSAELLSADLQAKGYTVQKMYESLGQVNSGAIINAINNGLGLVSMIGHGTYGAWGNSTGVLFWQNSNIASLNNGVKLPVGHQASCLTGAFDNENPSKYPGPTQIDSMAEEFLMKQGGGHIANYGYSRVAYGGKGSDHPNVTSGYMNHVLFNLLADGPTTPGKALSDARDDCLQEHGVSFVGDYKHMSMLNTFGDPSTALGGVGLSITSQLSQIEIEPDGTYELNLTVKNVGAYDTTADLSVSGPGAPWSALINTQTVTLATGQQRALSMTISVDNGTVAGEIGKFNLTASSRSNGRAATQNIVATVKQVHGIDVTATEITRSALPGEEATFGIQLTNTGNGEDRALLTLSDSPATWDIVLEDASLDLAPFGTTDTNISVSLPDQVEAGIYTFDVTATLDGTAISEVMTLHVEVLTTHGFSVSCLQCGEGLLPGEETVLTLEIQSAGNAEEDISVTDVLLPGGWAYQVDPQSLSIPPYSTGEVDVTVRASETALVGTYPVTITFTASQSTIDFTTNLTVKMVQGLEIVPPTDSPLVIDGEVTSITISINNTGNVGEDLAVECLEEPQGWNVEITPDLFSLGAFESREVAMNVTTKRGTPPDEYTVRILATGNEGLESEATVIIDIEERPEFSAALEEAKIGGKPGTTVTNTVHLENTGNMVENLALGQAPVGDLKILTKGESVGINPGGSGKLTFKVSIPKDALAGELTYAVVVQREAGDITLDGILEVQEVHDVGVDVEPGLFTSRKVTISNNGNCAEAITIKITGTTASWASLSKREFTLDPGKKNVVQVTITPPKDAVTGTYPLLVEVETESGYTITKDLAFQIEKSEGPSSSAGGIEIAIGLAIVAVVVMIVMLLLYLRKREPKIQELEMDGPPDDEDVGLLEPEDEDGDMFPEADEDEEGTKK